MNQNLDQIKDHLRGIARAYTDKEERARRLYIEERAFALKDKRDIEFSLKTDISNFFQIPYSNVSFCGSGQIGFSIKNNRAFDPFSSDLDVACINGDLYQKAWKDIITTTGAFNDESCYSGMSRGQIDLFKAQILRRGMILVDFMPKSNLSLEWRRFQDEMSRKFGKFVKSVTVAIYINEYAFCWKQDSALTELMGK